MSQPTEYGGLAHRCETSVAQLAGRLASTARTSPAAGTTIESQSAVLVAPTDRLHEREERRPDGAADHERAHLGAGNLSEVTSPEQARERGRRQRGEQPLRHPPSDHGRDGEHRASRPGSTVAVHDQLRDAHGHRDPQR